MTTDEIGPLRPLVEGLFVSEEFQQPLGDEMGTILNMRLIICRLNEPEGDRPFYQTPYDTGLGFEGLYRTLVDMETWLDINKKAVDKTWDGKLE